MTTVRVKFYRELGDDVDVAKVNFPKLPRAKALKEQFLYELAASKALKGTFKVVKVNKAADEFTLDFKVNGKTPHLSIQKTLQRGYDKHFWGGRFLVKGLKIPMVK